MTRVSWLALLLVLFKHVEHFLALGLEKNLSALFRSQPAHSR